LTFKYNIYGLRVGSRFKLGVYPQSSFKGTADVLIKKAKISRPEEGLERTVYKPYSVYNTDLYFLDVMGIAKYLVKGDNEVLLEKYPEANWQDVFAFLFDSIFTVILVKNNIFVFHASAVSFGKKSFMFCGTAGIGKSTLAASLAANKGAKIIEDDKCLVQYNKKTGKFQIKNQYPFIELWKPQLGFVKKIKGLVPKSRIRKNIQKFRIDIQEHRPKRAINLDQIILLNMSNMEDTIQYTEIKGIQKVNVVKNYSHMHHVVPALGKNKEHFMAISKIVQGIPVHSINKSRLTKLEDFIRYIEEEVI